MTDRSYTEKPGRLMQSVYVIGVLREVGVVEPDAVAVAASPDREDINRAVVEHAARYGHMPALVTWRADPDGTCERCGCSCRGQAYDDICDACDLERRQEAEPDPNATSASEAYRRAWEAKRSPR